MGGGRYSRGSGSREGAYGMKDGAACYDYSEINTFGGKKREYASPNKRGEHLVASAQ
jgi:hypothetical protein